MNPATTATGDAENDPDVVYRPLILDEADPDDVHTLARLGDRADIDRMDLRPGMRAELSAIAARSGHVPRSWRGRWVFYPWRRRLVGVLADEDFRAVRLDRNRNKLTVAEQRRLQGLSVGVVGQSVGHAVAYALALEGVCGRLRLADFDRIELSNLNRIAATIFDIGLNKAIVTARRIAEIDPYLPVDITTAGVDEHSVDAFIQGLSVVVEECDSLDVKLLVRQAARRQRVPVIMDTSDRGLLDVERFDLEPQRPLLHGLLGGVQPADLRGLSSRDKAPYVLRVLDPEQISPRMGASLAEVDQTLLSWPQLASEVFAGSATTVTAIRRLGLGHPLPSGRIRIDLDRALTGLTQPAVLDESTAGPAPAICHATTTPVARILECAQRAPSGGNTQPWALCARAGEIRLHVTTCAPVAMDVGYRGSAVALGAALYNARSAASALGLLGPHQLIVDPAADAAPLTAILRLGGCQDPALAADYPGALRRETNRRLGSGAPLPAATVAALTRSVAAEGARLVLLTAPAQIAEMARILAESDRVRYLTPTLHRQLMAELRWPDEDVSTGIDIRSLELGPDERAALEIGRRWDVMAELKAWSAGAALGDYTRDRVASASAVAVVCGVPPGGDIPELVSYARAGMAVERMWIAAQRLGLAVQPVSPVFLYARACDELVAVSPDYADTLAALRGRLMTLLGVGECGAGDGETMALVLRLSYTTAASVRSRRRGIPEAVSH